MQQLLAVEPPAAAVAPEVSAAKPLASESDQSLPYYSRADDPDRLHVVPETFAGWYAGSTDAELRDAKRRAGMRVNDMLPEAMQRQYDQGIYEAELRVRNTSPDAMGFQDDLGLQADLGFQGDLGLVDQETLQRQLGILPAPVAAIGLARSSRVESLGGDAFLVKSTVLPWDEHTHVYDARDELSWLTLELEYQGQVALRPPARRW